MLCLLHAVAVEGRLNVVRRRLGFALGLTDAFFEGGQNLFGIVKIALPDAGGVVAGVFQQLVCGNFVHVKHLLGRLLAAFVAPFDGGMAVAGNVCGHKEGGTGKDGCSLRYFCLFFRPSEYFILDKMYGLKGV